MLWRSRPRVWKESAGVISAGPCWCCAWNGYLYTHQSFFGLVWQVITEYENDRHLVG